jgi:hypothetical protein
LVGNYGMLLLQRATMAYFRPVHRRNETPNDSE